MRSIVLGLTWLVFASASSSACECLPWKDGRPSATEEMKGVSAVFTGRVDRVRRVDLEHDPSPFRNTQMLMVRIHVDRAWKGVRAGSRVWVITDHDEAVCGFGFVRHGEYLVYAGEGSVLLKGKHEPKRMFGTGFCDRTKSLDGATADIEDLGEPASKVAP